MRREGLHSFVRQVLALQFLPSAHIQQTVQMLQMKATTDATRALIGYLRRQCLDNPLFPADVRKRMYLMYLLESLKLKGEVLFLLMAFLTICTSVIANSGEPDYSQCHHDFSEGCPVHDSRSWKCAKQLKNCTDPDRHYHCIRNTKDKIMHVCVPVMKCLKGTQPVYNEEKSAISCEPCPQGYFQASSVWSDEVLVCEERNTCDIQSHKIECPVGLELEKTQDVLCRCDARNNFVPLNVGNTDKCFSWTFTCWEFPCPGNGTERLLNYTCRPKCQEGLERNERDICVPIGENRERNTTTTGSLPPNKTVTATSTTPAGVHASAPEYTVPIVFIVVALGVIVVVAAVIIAIVCCVKARNKDSSKNGTPQELEPLQNGYSSPERNNVTPSAVQPNSQTGLTVNLTINSEIVQIGDRNMINIRPVDDDDDDDNASNSDTANSKSTSSENEGNIARHSDTSLDMPPSGDSDLNNIAHVPEENESPQDIEETLRKIP
ncbi:hypothetical protein CHS0354_016703 [Potamilus streckersoni]|uniref:Uncharacterized protein n=1 Tax=Potamilus streckersoni TaxID=2493646 RepID=A0AAE0TJX8_9BIVA|nr:hypothetical protein CHS0354_016703 [Potamilus streckersoni]